MTAATVRTYLEVGEKRTFAGAIEWPGWCRSGRDPDAALETLHAYASRYAKVLRGRRLGFEAPKDTSAFEVVERVRGDATTDFGAPGVAPRADGRPIEDADLRRLTSILRGGWRTFDAAVEGARGKRLAKGPRGGGRDLVKIVEHVTGADGGYVAMLGRKVGPGGRGDALERTRVAILEALEVTAREGPPPPGPRGGKRWLPRYFVRRVTWHVLDHAWELEDRSA